MDDFNDYCVNIDSECLHQDFDDVDLYGTKLEEDSYNDFDEDIEFE